MESLMYCEINLLCAVILAIMAIKVMRSGLDASLKKTVFVTALLFAMAMNVFDALWAPGLHLFHFPHAVLYILTRSTLSVWERRRSYGYASRKSTARCG